MGFEGDESNGPTFPAWGESLAEADGSGGGGLGGGFAEKEEGVGGGAWGEGEAGGGWGGGEDAFEHDESGGVVGLVAVG